MMHRFSLLFVFAVGLLIAFATHAEDVRELWLDAEANAGKPHVAIAKWMKVLNELPEVKSAGEGLTHEAAKMQLFHSLLNAGRQSRDINLIKQAYQLGDGLDMGKKAFADTLVAKAAIGLDKKFALKALRSAKTNALKLKNFKEQGEALHAIGLAALTQTKSGKLLFEWDGAEIAEEIIPYIVLGNHRAQLMQMLAQHQSAPGDEWGKKLHAVVRISDKKQEKKRNKALLALHKSALKADKFNIALDAVSAITDYSEQQETFYEWFKKSFKAKDYSRAATIAGRIEDGRYAANSWGELAEHYYSTGQKNRANDAIEKSYYSALSTRREDRRMHALTSTAISAGEINNTKVAEQAMQQAGLLEGELVRSGSEKSFDALAAYIKALAEGERVAEAQERLSSIRFTDSKLRTRASTAVAKALAETNKPEAALDLLDDYSPESGDRLDKAYYAIAKAFAEQKLFDKARDTGGKIKDAQLRLKIEAFIDGRQHSSLNETGNSALQAPFFSALYRKVQALPAAQQEQTLIDLAEMLVDQPALPLQQWHANVRSQRAKDELLALRAVQLAKQEKIEEASRLMKQVDDPARRAKAYRRLSYEISLHTDLFGFIGEKRDPIIDEIYQEVEAASDSTQISGRQIEERFAALAQQKQPGLEMAAPKVTSLGFTIPEMDFPERLAFDHAYVKAQLPPLTPFSVNPVYYENSFFINTKFKIAIAYADKNLIAGNTTPEILYISRGTTSLPLLYDALNSMGLQGYITRKGREYTLNNGLLIGPDAGLVIDGSEVSKLYQSQQDSAILVNAGHLYITDTSVIGWDKRKNKPAYANYEDRYDFRPFIASWSRSHTYLAGSEFIAIGYNNHKSYGISLSAGPEKLEQATITEPQRPDGILVDNSFDNLYYGFYSYEADNVALIGNEYRENIIYGIDPHDRSRWLTIAFNTAYDAKKKHGIIVSREVNDSSYIGNLSFDNKGSGYMIDRLSTGTFVYGNTGFGNKQDGLTLFESSCNFVSSNHFFHNKSMGIRVRNSQDNGIFFNRLADNRQGGISTYISELLDDPAHKRRNFAMDPYADVAAMSLVGNTIESNGTGVIVNDTTALLMRGNRFINQAPKAFDGDWFTEHPYFSSQYDIRNKGIFMGQKCPTGKWLHHNCRFRKDGLYNGDAQSNLEQRVVNSSCKQPSKQDAHI